MFAAFSLPTDALRGVVALPMGWVTWSPRRGGVTMELVDALAVLSGEWAWFRLNQWIVERKGLDHRPWFAPSFWGPIGTLCIVMAHPRGWSRPSD